MRLCDGHDPEEIGEGKQADLEFWFFEGLSLDPGVCFEELVVFVYGPGERPRDVFIIGVDGPVFDPAINHAVLDPVPVVHGDLVDRRLADDRQGVLADGPEDPVPGVDSELAPAGADEIFHKLAVGDAPGPGLPLSPAFFEFNFEIPGLCRRPRLGTPAKGLPDPSTVIVVDAVDETVFFGVDRHISVVSLTRNSLKKTCDTKNEAARK